LDGSILMVRVGLPPISIPHAGSETDSVLR
jgi:hypothetical protein